MPKYSGGSVNTYEWIEIDTLGRGEAEFEGSEKQVVGRSEQLKDNLMGP